jgi:hypothetical protein
MKIQSTVSELLYAEKQHVERWRKRYGETCYVYYCNSVVTMLKVRKKETKIKFVSFSGYFTMLSVSLTI